MEKQPLRFKSKTPNQLRMGGGLVPKASINGFSAKTRDQSMGLVPKPDHGLVPKPDHRRLATAVGGGGVARNKPTFSSKEEGVVSRNILAIRGGGYQGTPFGQKKIKNYSIAL